jgi:hypothetical protein
MVEIMANMREVKGAESKPEATPKSTKPLCWVDTSGEDYHQVMLRAYDHALSMTRVRRVGEDGSPDNATILQRQSVEVMREPIRL